MYTTSFRWPVIILLTASATISGYSQTVPQPSPIPTQEIVMVIDNSGSMAQSDPLRLRGVAAGLILDAVEVTSDVKAGLVMFNNVAETDGQFHETDKVRQRLQAAQLPAPNGGTNMEEALEKAIAMFGSSKADIKRIVIITDGVPDKVGDMLTNLMPHAKQAGIQIFALGFSGAVNQAFLDQLTVPTGGQTLVTPNQQKLLESAKQLVGNLDSIFNLKDHHLASNETNYEFDLPAGADRARVTAILDQPQAFGPNEIQFTLQGPPGTGDQAYIIRDDAGNDRVAAWTTFFSTPGHYTFHVTTTRPGVSGHLGLHFFAEALSSMHVQLIVSPKQSSYVVGEELRVDVQASTGIGTINPAGATVVSFIKTPSGGSLPVSFSNLQGVVQIPNALGRQTLVVRVVTPLAHGEAHYDYDVVDREPAELQSDPPTLKLTPLGAAHPPAEASFKLTPIFKSGNPRPIKFSFTVVTPVGTAELLGPSGTVFKAGGVAQYVLPPKGLDLKLRVKLDPNKTLPESGTKLDQTIEFTSPEGRPFSLKFEGIYQKPKFELLGKLTDFTLWWDPHRERTVKLGVVHTDLSDKSTFLATIPGAIYDASKGTKIADLKLRAGGVDLPDPEPVDNGKLRYGPIDLPPGSGVPLELIVTPDPYDGWELQPGSSQFDIRLASSLGMVETAAPRFWSGGAVELPILKPQTLSGRNILTASWRLLAGFILLLIGWVNGRKVARFWRYRPGTVQAFGVGPILLGGPAGGGGAAIALPSVNLPDDVRTMGEVVLAGNRLYLQSSIESIVRNPELSPNDTITIPDDPNLAGDEWELEFVGYSADDGGEVEVTGSPARWTPGRLLKWVVAASAILLFGTFLLGTAIVARLAYHIPLIESWFYVK